MNLALQIQCGELHWCLEFLPLSTVDYSGELIISDWYTDSSNKNQALKLQLDFYLIQYKQIVSKSPYTAKNAQLTKHVLKCLDQRIQEELVASILREATILEKELKLKE